MYESGVYRYSREPEYDQKHDHDLVGTHSVKVIGWGEERGSKYWVRLLLYNHYEYVDKCYRYASMDTYYNMYIVV